MIHVAVLGFGNIGGGVVELLEKNRNLITDVSAEEINVKYILDIRDFSDHPLAYKIVSDFSVIAEDPEISVVIETMGGTHPAYDFTLSLLKAGKHVVTSNKEVVANYGDELLKVAAEHNVKYLFEASVGGGIPIIRPMMHSLVGDSIYEINGILNGTTNYILTKMAQDGDTLYDALGMAQTLGYAEKNPSADINGQDAGRKICILAAIATGKLVSPEQVETTGIASITQREIADAGKLGYALKLIASMTVLEDGKLQMMVAPRFVAKSNPLASVDDVFNGIMVRGRAVGDVMFYGKGAGKYPTASAVISDIIEIVSNVHPNVKPMLWERADAQILADVQTVPCRFYVRIAGDTHPDFAGERISDADGQIAFLTPVMTEQQLIQNIKTQNLESCSVVRVMDV